MPDVYPPYIFGMHDPGGEFLMADKGRRGWIVFTHEAMPSDNTLLRMFGSLGQAHLAPDGQVAFRAYRFAPGQIPSPQPCPTVPPPPPLVPQLSE